MAKFKLKVEIVPMLVASMGQVDGSVKRLLHITDLETTLSDLKLEVAQRFHKMYPNEPQLSVDKFQDEDLMDLDPEYQVDDVFTEGKCRAIVTFQQEAPVLINRDHSDYFQPSNAQIPQKLPVPKTPHRQVPAQAEDLPTLPPPLQKVDNSIPVKHAVPRNRVTLGMLNVPAHARTDVTEDADATVIRRVVPDDDISVEVVEDDEDTSFLGETVPLSREKAVEMMPQDEAIDLFKKNILKHCKKKNKVKANVPLALQIDMVNSPHLTEGGRGSLRSRRTNDNVEPPVTSPPLKLSVPSNVTPTPEVPPKARSRGLSASTPKPRAHDLSAPTSKPRSKDLSVATPLSDKPPALVPMSQPKQQSSVANFTDKQPVATPKATNGAPVPISVRQPIPNPPILSNPYPISTPSTLGNATANEISKKLEALSKQFAFFEQKMEDYKITLDTRVPRFTRHDINELDKLGYDYDPHSGLKDKHVILCPRDDPLMPFFEGPGVGPGGKTVSGPSSGSSLSGASPSTTGTPAQSSQAGWKKAAFLNQALASPAQGAGKPKPTKVLTPVKVDCESEDEIELISVRTVEDISIDKLAVASKAVSVKNGHLNPEGLGFVAAKNTGQTQKLPVYRVPHPILPKNPLGVTSKVPLNSALSKVSLVPSKVASPKPTPSQQAANPNFQVPNSPGQGVAGTPSMAPPKDTDDPQKGSKKLPRSFFARLEGLAAQSKTLSPQAPSTALSPYLRAKLLSISNLTSTNKSPEKPEAAATTTASTATASTSPNTTPRKPALLPSTAANAKVNLSQVINPSISATPKKIPPPLPRKAIPSQATTTSTATIESTKEPTKILPPTGKETSLVPPLEKATRILPPKEATPKSSSKPRANSAALNLLHSFELGIHNKPRVPGKDYIELKKRGDEVHNKLLDKLKESKTLEKPSPPATKRRRYDELSSDDDSSSDEEEEERVVKKERLVAKHPKPVSRGHSPAVSVTHLPLVVPKLRQTFSTPQPRLVLTMSAVHPASEPPNKKFKLGGKLISRLGSLSSITNPYHRRPISLGLTMPPSLIKAKASKNDGKTNKKKNPFAELDSDDDSSGSDDDDTDPKFLTKLRAINRKRSFGKLVES